MVNFIPTICPYCGAGCGLLLVAKDGLVVDTQPWPRHPISEGRLCLKGWNAHEFVHHADRLTKPLIKGDGAFREVSWDEALSLIAGKLEETESKHGPDAIALLSSAKCTNEENYLVQKLARAVIGTNNVDHCARLCHAPTVAGLAAAFGSGAMTNSILDIKESDCIFVIGSDTSAQHPLVATRVVMAKERGARLIVADPRRIHLCHLADVHLALRPGTEVALLNGMMKVIIDRGLQDTKFIEERTEGFDQLAELLKDYPLEEVQRITGVPAADIEQAALMYVQAKPSAILFAMGVTQHTTGTDNVMAIANLAMLIGNMGLPGAGINPLRGQNNVQGACDMGALPNVLPGYQAVTDAEKRAKIAEMWGLAQLPEKAGLTVVEMMTAACQGNLKAMYIVGENPMLSDPDIGHVQQGLESLDFLAVQDIFLSETAKLADVILPAACWAEKEGTFTNTDRRVQMIRKAVEPPGEARPDWQIVCQLAKAMGSGELFRFASPSEIFEEIRKGAAQYAGMSYERLNQPDGLQWPCPDESHPGTPILHTHQFTRGKGRFNAVGYRKPTEEPDEEYPYLLTTGRVMAHWHTGTMTRRSPTLNDEFPEGFIEVNPEDAQKLGIKDGDSVQVASRRGNIQTKALVTDRVKPGVVFMPFHFAESAANVLTSSALDPVAKIPELKVCAVNMLAAKPQ